MSKHFFIGTSTWSQKDWVGNFYPPKTKPDQYLAAYSEKLPTTEIDSTFYAIPRRSVVENWYSKTPPAFRFSAKFPRVITHEKYLKDVQPETLHFLNTMLALKEKLAALLIQLPPEFEANLQTVETMKTFLAALPTKEIRFALEVRNPSWLREKFYDRLRNSRVALVLTDQPAMKNTIVETADFAYLRWLGDRRELAEPFTELKLDKSAELKAWASAVQNFKAETVFGYFNNHFAGHSPTSAKEFSAMLKNSD
jgi:uncharacterized protein YecE (DUF72 family)